MSARLEFIFLIDLKAAFKSGEIIPKRRLGQCFLTDRSVAERIVNAIRLAPGDHVIEVGPGACALTELLCERSITVTAVEIDRRLKGIIGAAMSRYQNFNLIIDDIMKVPADALASCAPAPWHPQPHHKAPKHPQPQRAIFVSNMPYYISTAIMTRLFEEFDFVSRAALMMQSEVAAKLLSAPSSENYCMLSVFAKSFGTLEKLFVVPPHCFAPQPGVESTVMLLEAHKPPLFANAGDKERYYKVVRAAFARRRKTIANSLLFAGLAPSRRQADAAAEAAGIPSGARGESLCFYDFLKLARAIANLAV